MILMQTVIYLGLEIESLFHVEDLILWSLVQVEQCITCTSVVKGAVRHI